MLKEGFGLKGFKVAGFLGLVEGTQSVWGPGMSSPNGPGSLTVVCSSGTYLYLEDHGT